MCIDINLKIKRVLMGFPRLNILEYAFDDYFEQIEETLKLIVNRHNGIYGNVTVGRYMEELAKLRREPEVQSIISKCIEEIKKELEKYGLSSICQSTDRWFYCCNRKQA